MLPMLKSLGHSSLSLLPELHSELSHEETEIFLLQRIEVTLGMKRAMLSGTEMANPLPLQHQHHCVHSWMTRTPPSHELPISLYI